MPKKQCSLQVEARFCCKTRNVRYPVLTNLLLAECKEENNSAIFCFL